MQPCFIAGILFYLNGSVMNNQQLYNQWAATYNEVTNKTRDMEMQAKQQILKEVPYRSVIELGCGTGKNTQWLLEKAVSITAVDFSESMMSRAKENVKSDQVKFIQADINQPWNFVVEKADLLTCSLVLEHIENLAPVFEKAAVALKAGGHFYIGELHPFKQYTGSKARFENGNETHELDCFIHHLSEFTHLAAENDFSLLKMDEWFDEDSKGLPRLMTLLLRKK
jgi:ubiquinone/menaquinone biosynthesis C-methylase UbiE